MVWLDSRVERRAENADYLVYHDVLPRIGVRSERGRSVHDRCCQATQNLFSRDYGPRFDSSSANFCETKFAL